MDAHPPHALLVGTSGMLRGATIRIASSHRVSLLARAPAALAGEIGPRALACPVDYHDDAALRRALHAAINAYGPPALAVVWIHGTAPDAPRTVCEVLAEAAARCRVINVRGSAAADPNAADDKRAELRALEPAIRYDEVVLGFIREPHGSRWLHPDEISHGVLHAIDSNAARHVVGTVTPWSARP